jgi:hypothetical protein
MARQEVIHGDDFYQMMILWFLPLAAAGKGIRRDVRIREPD